MSVTAVPLQPIQRGSVRRLWLGMLLVAAVAIVLAWAGLRQFGRTASGMHYQILSQGTGASPSRDDFALVGYKGWLPDGTMFEENAGTPMELQTLTPGFAEAVTLLKKGGKLNVWVPANLAYGATPPPGSPIPANSALQFQIHLIEFRTRAEIMETQRQMQLQQMLQQQMGGGEHGGDMPPGALSPDAMPPAGQ